MISIKASILLILIAFAACEVTIQENKPSINDASLASYTSAVDSLVKKIQEARDQITDFRSKVQVQLASKEDVLTKCGAIISAKRSDFTALKAKLKNMITDTGARVITLERTLNNINTETDKFTAAYSSTTKQILASYVNRKMYSKSTIVGTDGSIVDCKNQGICKKVGSPTSFNDSSYATNKWNNKFIFNVGVGENAKGVGMEVNITCDANEWDTLWVRCSNHVWGRFSIIDDRTKEDLGQFCCGYRTLNEISPDGAAPDSDWNYHAWMPVPVPKCGKYIIQSRANSDGWISGIAFGKNENGHARNSAVCYHWACNGGENLVWNTHDWNRDNLAQANAGAVRTLMVPVVPNGKEKLLYIVEHNNNWVGTMHYGVKVNGVSIERFRHSYTNPFATHFNSKLYDRYIAARIPANVVGSNRLIKVEIDMTKSDHNIYLREVGTHDY